MIKSGNGLTGRVGALITSAALAAERHDHIDIRISAGLRSNCVRRPTRMHEVPPATWPTALQRPAALPAGNEPSYKGY